MEGDGEELAALRQIVGQLELTRFFFLLFFFTLSFFMFLVLQNRFVAILKLFRVRKIKRGGKKNSFNPK